MTSHGPRINVLLRGEQTDGRLAVMDNVVRTGFGGPSLHRHAFDETFYVLGPLPEVVKLGPPIAARP